jgi:hypothetical protein
MKGLAMHKLLLAVLLSVSICHADDVYLKNGKIYKNVLATIDASYQSINIDLGNYSEVLEMNVVWKVDHLPVDKNMVASIITMDDTSKANLNRDLAISKDKWSHGNIDNTKYVTTYPNSGFVAVGLLAGVGAYLCFSQASEKSDQSAAVNSLASAFHTTANTSEIDDKSTGYTVVGVVAVVVGLGSIIYGLTPVRVSATKNGVNLSYNF